MKKATLTRVIAMLLVVMMTFTALPIVSFASKDYQDSVDTGSTSASSFSSSSYEAYLYNYAVLFGMTDVTAAVNANKPAKGTTVTVYDASNARGRIFSASHPNCTRNASASDLVRNVTMNRSRSYCESI